MRKLPISKQLKLTLWKFAIIFQCSWKYFLIETLIKVFIIYILSFIIKEGTVLEPLTKEGEQITAEDMTILYYPAGDFQDTLMQNFINNPRTPGATVQSVPIAEQIERIWENSLNERPDVDNVVGVVFNEANEDALQYTVRLSDNARLKQSIMRTTDFDRTFWKVYTKRFICIQMVIDSIYMQTVTGQTVIQEDPEPMFTRIELSTVHKTILLQTFTSWTGLFICTTLFRSIMDEKQSGLKEFQNALGLSSIMLWIGRLIDMVAKTTLSNAAIAYAMTFVIDFKWVLLWVYLTLYAMKAASFLFFMSVFFHDTMAALVFVAILWTTTGNVGKFLILYSYEFTHMPSRFVFAFVFPNVGLALGFYSIATLQRLYIQQVAAKIKEEETTFMSILALMMGSTMFFLFMTFYLDPIWEKEIGVNWKIWPRKRYRGAARSPRRQTVVDVDYVLTADHEAFQSPPMPANPAVRMRQVSKSYGAGKKKIVVLDEINLDFYTNEVTLILGENGCGKSTLMNTINGVCVPTNGTVYVQSMDVRDEYDLNLIRPQIGWCPQTNINMGCMTVKQLLTYVGKLRGLDKDEIDFQMNYLLDTLALRSQASKKPSGSGSTRRLVCFAFAVMGRPPIILLDEPAAGIDIEGKRLIWSVIKELRKNRVIIIATNHMDLVDEVADRVVILKGGKVSCWGSPRFLINHIGEGFILNIERSYTASTSIVKRAVFHYFPDALRRQSKSSLMSYRLAKTKRHRLPRLIGTLRRLGVQRLSLNPCSMEDVFFEFTIPLPTADKEVEISRLMYALALKETEGRFEGARDVTSMEQLKALIQKELLYMQRSWVVYFIGITLQICIITAIIMVSEWKMQAKVMLRESLSLAKYKGVALCERSNMLNLDHSYQEIVRELQSTLLSVSNIKEFADEGAKKGDRAKICYKHWIGARLHNIPEGNGIKYGTPMYSLVGTFCPQVSVNLLNNAILRALGRREVRIKINQFPLNKEKMLIVAHRMGAGLWGGLMVIILALWLSVFGLTSLQEKVRRSFRTQRLAGATSILYWTSRYLCHITLHGLLTCILLITTITGGVNMYSCPSAAGAIFVIWLLYGFAGIPFIYLLTHFFATSGDLVMCLIATCVSVFALFEFIEHFPTIQYYYSRIFKHFLFFLPSCNAKVALTKLYAQILTDSPCRLEIAEDCPIGYNNKSAQQRECMIPRGYLISVWENIIYLILTGIMYLVIVIWWDTTSMWLRRVRNELKKSCIETAAARREDGKHKIEEDSDVMKERILAQVGFANMQSRPRGYYFVLPPPNMLVTNDLCLLEDVKTGRRDPGVNLRVRSGSTLGLLGADRSSRSLLIYLLSGVALPAHGDVAGIACKLSQNRKRFMSNIGFLGIEDGLIPSMTVYEMINFICKLKGVSIEHFQLKWNPVIGLNAMMKRKCGSLSQGRKRLLGIVLAMIGEPSVLVMDMPTNTMDPRTRRRVGNAFARYISSNRSIVLTTNSLTDIQNLCTVMACVHMGRILCIGTPLYLRERYRSGYAVIIELDNVDDSLSDLRQAMRDEFEGRSKCSQVNRGKVLFVVMDEDMKYERLVMHLESVVRNVPGIRGYMFRETSILHILSEGVTQTRFPAKERSSK